MEGSVEEELMSISSLKLTDHRLIIDLSLPDYRLVIDWSQTDLINWSPTGNHRSIFQMNFEVPNSNHLPAVSQIWSFIFLSSSSIVLILKSIPGEEERAISNRDGIEFISGNRKPLPDRDKRLKSTEQWSPLNELERTYRRDE